VLAESEATFQVDSGELLDELAEAAKSQKDPAVFCSLNYSRYHCAGYLAYPFQRIRK
jgi:hypothetical protein